MTWKQQAEDLDALRSVPADMRPERFPVRPDKPYGVCMIGRCTRLVAPGIPADDAQLCEGHLAFYRPRCSRCGEELTDSFADLGLCRACCYRLPAAEVARITELARRKRAAAWWALLDPAGIPRARPPAEEVDRDA